MSLPARFVQAQADSKNLSERPDNTTLLRLYALFKQASSGDAEGKRPGFMDIVGRAKWDAWDALKSTSKEDSMQQYIDLIEELKTRVGTSAPGGSRKMTDINEAAATLRPPPAIDEARIARGIDAKRRAFLDAAFQRHLGPESRADLPGIVASYSKGGHLNFNGAIYDTPERLLHFHRAMGFDGQGMLANLGATISHISYTYDSVIVEYVISGMITADLGGAPAGRHVLAPSCVVYEFDEDGALRSERIYLDTGNWLAQPIFRP